MSNLWSDNTPTKFWGCRSSFSSEDCRAAVHESVGVLALPNCSDNIDSILETVLGEAQFGADRYRFSRARNTYYSIKPFLPRSIALALRQVLGCLRRKNFLLDWPIEARYARFQWEVMKNLLIRTGQVTSTFVHFWPEGQRFAFVLTHDVEADEGQKFVRVVADLDESFGFHSSFNFVPERYTPDLNLIEELKQRGFEVGVHGLKHDGRLFSSFAEFSRRAKAINRYLNDWGAVGFRAPLMHRQPEWMQALNIEYDLSFFDTDPWEPIPGGTMAIWPYFLGHFVELPYTLAQDCTLINVLKQTTPELWLRKIDFLQQYYGLALLNTHPDYLLNKTNLEVYIAFLQAIKARGGYWHALPKTVARWWRQRAEGAVGRLGTLTLADEGMNATGDS
jgi:hypothetical protein